MVFGLIAGRLNAPIAIVSLEIGVIASIWVWRRFRSENRSYPEIKFLPALLYSFIVFAGLQHFLYLLYYDQHSLKTLHINNFGDLSMHIQYIRHMASGARFWPDNPEYAGELLRYPLGMDLYNALWEVLGVPTDSHLFVVGVVMTLVAVSLLHRWMNWWGVGAFFLNGGLSNFQCFWRGGLNDFQNETAWKNFLLSIWITQRGFLFAIPAGVYVIKTVTEALLGERTLSRLEKTLCVVLWSSLAWFHLHSFFIVSLVLGISMALYKKMRLMADIFVPAVIIGLPYVFFASNSFSSAGVLHIQWNWVAGQENFLKFWIVNLGPWIFLGALAACSVFKKAYVHLRSYAVVVFVLFFVFTFVMLAPWDWDNIKILLWLYLMIAWLVWRTWLSRLSPIVLCLVACVVFLPGAISLVSSLPGNSGGVELYRAEDIYESKAALMDVPVNSVLATAPDPNHPAMFWGAKVAMAYTGHLWSHGIHYEGREPKLEGLFKGREDWLSIARDIGVTHIYWGDSEKRKYGSFNPPWLHQLKNISRSAKIDVYDLQGVR